MKGSIFDSATDRQFSYIGNIFKAIGNVQLDYNWLVTNRECYPQSSEIEDIFYNQKDYTWLTGEEFTQIINKEDFFWTWGVFSGFKKDIELEEVLKYDLPFADGYGGFWKPKPSIQHPLADIEIVEWDSTLAMVISKDDKIAEDFRRYFPLAEDLEEYNKK